MDAQLNGELAQGIARLAGLDLSLERAAEVAVGLESILRGDAEIAALDLGPLSPIGPTWPEPAGE